MAAETASNMPAATTPNTPKACLAIDAPFVSAGPLVAGRVQVPRGAPESARPPNLECNLRLSLGAACTASRQGSSTRSSQRCEHAVRIQFVAERCGVGGVLHIGCACVGIALCTSPETRTHTTQHMLTQPPRSSRLRDS